VRTPSALIYTPLAEKNRPAAKFPHQHTELPFFQRIQWVVGGSLSAVVLCKIVSFLFKLEDAPEQRFFFTGITKNHTLARKTAPVTPLGADDEAKFSTAFLLVGNVRMLSALVYILSCC
jgi:hypothetical protein